MSIFYYTWIGTSQSSISVIWMWFTMEVATKSPFQLGNVSKNLMKYSVDGQLAKPKLAIAQRTYLRFTLNNVAPDYLQLMISKRVRHFGSFWRLVKQTTNIF